MPFNFSSIYGNLRKHCNVFKNLNYKSINAIERASNTGKFTSNGTYCIYTGRFTGRSPNDKYFVQDENTKNIIWWGDVNHPVTSTQFNNLFTPLNI